MISIHALLAESDAVKKAFPSMHIISIHALLAESDVAKSYLLSVVALFLSTLSLRRATCGRRASLPVAGHFYPRSPCGERLNIRQIQKIENGISIHALLAESDVGLYLVTEKDIPISIHALLAESDILFGGALLCIVYFYPRSPCGERRSSGIKQPRNALFSIPALLAESVVNCRLRIF